jgi:uncharacterized membrane protein YedE/YeeE
MNPDVFLQAFLGGCLIGIGAIILMLFNGRVAGISGITFSAVFSRNKTIHWHWYFLVGLVLAPLLSKNFGFPLPVSYSSPFEEVNGVFSDVLMMLLGGFLVGVGTKLGSGCTSGHGICGISRFSRRSITATCVFMLSAIITVACIKHIFGVTL